ncbi:uncharacterized protein LOC107841395 [Capsicum annuum]|uniref:uncharacterized protein LOC107841395 n=1 Tax=Capsicum annuum TaxID=4072 RepID=UPI0007BF497B|nr:uncharacterized protein LOC107841395 [Capsicum annuum]
MKTKSTTYEEALVERGFQQSQTKGRRGRSKSKGRAISKDECSFCHKKGHWKKEFPKLKEKGKSLQDVNVAECKSNTEQMSGYWIQDELNGGVVYLGNNNPYKTTGICLIKLRNHDGSTRIFRDVQYVPKLKRNLISLGALESKGLVVMIRDGVLKATSGELVMLKGMRKNNLYYYQGSTVLGTVAAAASSTKKDVEVTKLWHMWLGYAGEKSLKILSKKGLLKVEARVENQKGRKIKVLQTENGGEYKSDPFLDVCQDCGIVCHFTVRKIPQQNGVSERMNKSLVEKVRCMLSNAGLGRKFWAEAVTYAQHLINHLPSSAIGSKTPLEVWSGKTATDYDTLHVFDSIAYYHVIESKLDPRAKKTLFMGFNVVEKGYRL